MGRSRLGAGQFCTKPGLVFAEAEKAGAFTAKLRAATAAGGAVLDADRGDCGAV